MKKLLLVCALLGSVSVYAQDHDKQSLSADTRAAQLQKVLQLSDEQTSKVKKVFEADAQQRKALREKYEPQFEAFRADSKTQREQTHTQLNAVLTPKQQQALEALHNGHDKRGHGVGEMDGEHGPTK
jgi:Spy/CpxP family protein refolding chaperone